MPKKRKTRKEKLLTDYKRQTEEEVTPSVKLSSHRSSQQTEPGITFSLPVTETHKKAPQRETQPQTESIAIATNEYVYLKTDLVKTAVITTAIAVTEMVIRFLYLH